MSRPKKREQESSFDPELSDLPDGARWREWMGRVEAAIFASREPLAREALARLVGPRCKLDDLIADIVDELRARPVNSSSSPAAGNFERGRVSRARSGRRVRVIFATLARPSHADNSGGDGDRLSATGDTGRIVAPRRQGNQPRRHRSPLSVWIHRRLLARARTRRALPLCHDKKVPGGF